MSAAAETLVEVENLSVEFGPRRQPVRAVNGVSFTVSRGEVLTILGESGSGKTVTMRALMRLLPERRSRLSGQLRVAGHDVLALDARALRRYRGRVAAMIFQEPMLAFDPVFKVGYQIEETIRRHEGVDRATARQRALELFELVRIPSARRRLDNYPHEFSGGMSQRAMIALALSCRPQLLLADEPTTALDATVQIQILLLLRELQRELGMAILFVTHDMGVANEISDRIAVMYAGRLVETGSAREVIRTASHPYTRGLMQSRASGVLRGQRLSAIPGAPPDLAAIPPGCAFAARCPLADADCGSTLPTPQAVSDTHVAACLRLPSPDASSP